jgi:hypothetical protein
LDARSCRLVALEFRSEAKTPMRRTRDRRGYIGVREMTRSDVQELQEHEVTLILVATSPLSREALEGWTLHAESVLADQAGDFALGASAAANFAANSIEVDFVVAVESPAEVHVRVARAVRILQDSGFTSPERPEAPVPMQLTSSATHAVAVCA